MDLGRLFKHRDYHLTVVIVLVIILILTFTFSLITIIVLTLLPLAFGAGYIYWRNKPSENFTAHGRSYSNTSFSNNSSFCKRWKVATPEEGYTNSFESTHSPEDMDRSGLRGSLLSPSVMSPGPRTRRSLLASPAALSPHRRASGELCRTPESLSSTRTLPRVRRVLDSSYNEGSSLLASPTQRLSIFSPRGEHSRPSSAHYPTHQPRYAGIGLMPPVHLQGSKNKVLSERNTSMLRSPVTVKVAPPDILKPPIPSIVPVVEMPEGSDNMPCQNPCDTQHVLSAIREKRKRTVKDEEVSPLVTTTPDSKRRKHHNIMSQTAHTNTNGNDDNDSPINDPNTTEIVRSIGTSLKRPAISRTRAESIVQMEEMSVKRSRSAGPVLHSLSNACSVGHERNAIDVSYSSSRRLLESQQEVSNSATKRQNRSFSHGRSAKKRGKPDVSTNNSLSANESSSSLGLSPRRMLSLVDKDTPMRDDTHRANELPREPTLNTSSMKLRSDKNKKDDVQTPDIKDIRVNPFPLLQSSSRRRQTQIRSESNTDAFDKVPVLRYTLTTEDYEKDRESDLKRVEQMLEDVEEAHAAKTAAKTANIKPPKESIETPTVSLGKQEPAMAAKISPLSKISTTSPTLPTSTLGINTIPTGLKGGGTETLIVASTLAGGNQISTTVSAVSSLSTATTVPTPSLSGVIAVTSTAAASIPTSGSKALPTSTSVSSPLQVNCQSTTFSAQATPIATASTTNALPATGSSFPPLLANLPSNSPVPTIPSASANAAVTLDLGVKPPPAYGSQPLSVAVTSTSAVGGGFKFGPIASNAVTTTCYNHMTFNAPVSSGSLFSGAATKPPTAASAGVQPGFNLTSGIIASTTTTSPATPFGNFGTSVSSSQTTPTPFGGQATSAIRGMTFPSSAGGFKSSTITSTVSAASAITFGAVSTSSAMTKPQFGNATGTMNPFGVAPAAAKTNLASSMPFTFGGGSSNKSTASPFGMPTSTTFGQADSTTMKSAMPTNSGSVFNQNPGAPAQTITFGQSASTSAAGTSIFGGGMTTSGISTGKPNTQPDTRSTNSTAFSFGASAPAKTTKSTTQFSFGATGTSTTSKTQAFTFGAQAPANKPEQAARASPAFGATGAGVNGFNSKLQFGSTPTIAFGSSQNAPTKIPTPTFGNSTDPFNVGVGKLTNTVSQPAFGAGLTGAFGSGQQQQMPSFGAPANTQASASFTFNALAKPNMNFGGASTQPAPATQSGGFAFGSSNVHHTGFKFSSGDTTQMGSQAPTFGTPTPNRQPAPNPFTPGGGAQGQSQGQGAFTIGSGNVQPRPRSMVRTARRRTTKR